MKNKKTRAYNSQIRRKQAEDTQNRIANAANELIRANGYENTTIGAIASQAGVATQTVYAIFNSKQGILMFLLKRAMQNATGRRDGNAQAGLEKKNLGKRIATLASRRNQQQQMTMSALGGFELLYPELYTLVMETDKHRRAMIDEYLRRLSAEELSAVFPDSETREKRLDLVWALTDGSLYHHMVVRAGWEQEDFEKALSVLLNFVFTDMDMSFARKG